MDGVLFTFPLYVWRNWRQGSFSGSTLGVYWRWGKAGAIDLDSLISACPLLSGCLMLVHLLLDIWPRKEMFAVRSGLRWHSILFPCRLHSHTTVMLASVHPEVLISSQPPVPKSLPHTQSYLPHFSSLRAGSESPHHSYIQASEIYCDYQDIRTKKPTRFQKSERILWFLKIKSSIWVWAHMSIMPALWN